MLQPWLPAWAWAAVETAPGAGYGGAGGLRLWLGLKPNLGKLGLHLALRLELDLWFRLSLRSRASPQWDQDSLADQ